MDPVFAKTIVSLLMVTSVAAFSLLTFRHAILDIVQDVRRARRPASQGPVSQDHQA